MQEERKSCKGAARLLPNELRDFGFRDPENGERRGKWAKCGFSGYFKEYLRWRIKL